MNIGFRKTAVALLATLLSGSGTVILLSQEPEDELQTPHAECALFGPKREQFIDMNRMRRDRSPWATQTVQVVNFMSSKRGDRYPAAAAASFPDLAQAGTIDSQLFKAMQENNVIPAGKTNDYEFIRRVTYDLIGRPPTFERIAQFVGDSAADKRAVYVEELLGRPEWIDKWAMFFGDLFENTANNAQVNRYPEGRNAFYIYIKNSLAANKKYNVMVTEMIAGSGDSSFDKGELNWTLGGLVSGGPRQDNLDQMAVNVAEKFLGLAHENCLLCHDGRRHLDTMSLWGKQETRLEGWQLASFFSRTMWARYPYNPMMPNANLFYYSVQENPQMANYALGTTTGNRPRRDPIGIIRNVAPEYLFGDGGKPNPGENYRAALARLVTSDIQFGRATVNYIWRQFFTRGIVEPANQFDPMRLDPVNPPPEPWTLQPTNPYLLNALSREFMDNGYDLKWLMRQIVNSEAYQLSARYDGDWKPEYEKYFARHFVRRLWGEEIMDGMSQIANVPQSYNINGGMGRITWAMQIPDTRGLPGEPTTSFLDSFLRGNRVDEDRRGDGAVPQVLNLMNDAFVMARTRASGTGASATLARRLLDKYTALNNNLLVNELFLNVLNRPASESEIITASVALSQGSTPQTRQQKLEDLVWALVNKLDYIYNY